MSQGNRSFIENVTLIALISHCDRLLRFHFCVCARVYVICYLPVKAPIHLTFCTMTNAVELFRITDS